MKTKYKIIITFLSVVLFLVLPMCGISVSRYYDLSSLENMAVFFPIYMVEIFIVALNGMLWINNND